MQDTNERFARKTVNTFVCPIIRDIFIEDCLNSLWEHCDMEEHRVIVIDQTKDGIYDRIKDKVHAYVRPHRNLGFASAMNMGIRMATTKYVTCANDDIVFIDKNWWDGILETFSRHPDMGGVNPFSIWETGWGYGAKPDKPERIAEVLKIFGKDGRAFERNGQVFFSYLANEDNITKEDIDYIKTVRPGMIDGIATWCTTFKRESLALKGLFDERFYPGGGEDYDIGGRFYDKDYPYIDAGRLRVCATSSSWVHHLWSQSRYMDKGDAMEGYPIEGERRWNRLGECFPEKEDKEDRHKNHCFNGHPTLSRGRVGNIFTVDL